MEENSRSNRPYNKDGRKQFKKRWSRQDFYVKGNAMVLLYLIVHKQL